MRIKKFNKYQSSTKEERIKLLKASIKRLGKSKEYMFVVQSYKSQLRQLQKQI